LFNSVSASFSNHRSPWDSNIVNPHLKATICLIYAAPLVYSSSFSRDVTKTYSL